MFLGKFLIKREIEVLKESFVEAASVGAETIIKDSATRSNE